ncbi:MAG: tRNA (adenine(22)-N(1))-methyltransferase [Cellulosilyticaceae bacterium]
MQLSNRLFHMAKLVEAGERVVDVGTDHGFIPIYLTTHDICSYCIAGDINKGPLDNARKHMEKYNVQGIDLRLGGGLSQVKHEDQINTIIIGGMGGPLIIDILRNDSEIVKGATRLILQPQNHVGDVRRYIHSIGFKIKEESFIKDDGKYYTIIHAIPGTQQYEHEYEYEYGKLLLQCPNELFIEWMNYKQTVFTQIFDKLEQTQTEQTRERQASLEKEYLVYREALKCIQ